MEIPSAVQEVEKEESARGRGGRSAELTFKAAHHAVEALGTELVVAKGSQEFADDDVGLLARVEAPHVGEDELDRAAPFERDSFL